MSAASLRLPACVSILGNKELKSVSNTDLFQLLTSMHPIH